jgi:sec-independent protein translocase protein TatB
VRDELGPDVDDIEWKKLDPRQYDPRQIVRTALADETASLPGAEPVVVAEAPRMRRRSDGRLEAVASEPVVAPGSVAPAPAQP